MYLKKNLQKTFIFTNSVVSPTDCRENCSQTQHQFLSHFQSCYSQKSTTNKHPLFCCCLPLLFSSASSGITHQQKRDKARLTVVPSVLTAWMGCVTMVSWMGKNGRQSDRDGRLFRTIKRTTTSCGCGKQLRNVRVCVGPKKQAA